MSQQEVSCCSFMQVEKRSPALFTRETDEIWSTETRWLRQPGGPAVHSSIQETGLLLSLVGAEMITEAKTYTKKIIKKSDVGKNDQVMVCNKEDKLVAQYFCDAGICRSEPDTVGLLIEQSGYLVLIMQNINPIDRFDALHNLKIILQNFTLDEVLLTSATPDLTDEDLTLNPSITQTVPPTSTTPSPAEEAPYQRHLEQPIMTETTGRLIRVVVGVVLALAAAVAVAVAVGIYLKSGRDGRIARAIAFFRRRTEIL